MLAHHERNDRTHKHEAHKRKRTLVALARLGLARHVDELLAAQILNSKFAHVDSMCADLTR